MIKTFKNLSYPNLTCFAHTLHRFLTVSLEQSNDENLQQIISKVRTISKIFRKSTMQFNKLK